ncbi:MAG: tyrosine--tRNA ligase [Candidatus Wildermuthbacteria bacterium]|nr:tyrosine--tRNA ligase [Candidatus Wildermuthbacteria bacterium]
MPKRDIASILTRRVETILPTREGLEQLMRQRKIKVYLGVDPTSPNLHLGHAVLFHKLREFQELGHKIILLFGTFTARIGDPSGRENAREQLTPQQVRQNMIAYKKQAAKILDVSKTIIKYNDTWLKRLTFEDVLKIASQFTSSQLLERDMFQQRFKEGKEVWMHELLYPLMQGYDSVALDVDLEIGAIDQTFNMLVGRKLEKIYRNKEKFVLTTPLLLGLDGRKMSKTYGNAVHLLDGPDEMYGKLMSLKDELVLHYFELCTDVPEEEIRTIAKALQERSISPRDLKARLAREIVTFYHGVKNAQKAEQEFIRVFREKQMPSRIQEVHIEKFQLALLDLLVETQLVPSRSEARRVITQGGVKIDGKMQKEADRIVSLQKGMVVQVGKRNFVRLA